MEESYCIIGRKPVAELFNSGKALSKIVLQQGLKSEDLENIAFKARKAGVQVQYVPKEKLDFLSKKFTNDRHAHHQGVLALAALGSIFSLEEILETAEKSEQVPLFIILDGVTDVGNLGAIARSALCFGATALIMPATGSAAVNPETIKRSAGALAHIPLCRVENIVSAIKLIKAHGIKIFSAQEDAKLSVETCDFSVACAIVFGDEGKGISAAVIKQCDAVFSIPMMGDFDSLNVSVSAGIALYEAMKQRNKQ